MNTDGRYRPSEAQRDYDARQLDRNPGHAKPRRVFADFMERDGTLVPDTVGVIVYPEDFIA